MTVKGAEVVICGAGIAGISTAYHLAVRGKVRDVLLVDERPPLSLTSDKSTECYRNFWPAPDGAMVSMMNRSIDLLESLSEESGDVFHLNRRGYVFATRDLDRVEGYRQAGMRAEELGAGPLRIHSGGPGEPEYIPAQESTFHDQPDGSDLILDQDLIRRHFPLLCDDTRGILHIRRAGWMSAQQLGAYLLRQAQSSGVRLLRDRIVGIDTLGGAIKAVQLAGHGRIETERFVNAAGPCLKEVALMMGIEVPVYCELHLKLAFKDHLGLIPRGMPMLIWGDAQRLDWGAQERAWLEEDEEYGWLLEELPAGVHTRPEGGADSQIILVLWEYNPSVMEPEFPPPLDPLYPEIILRGLSTMIPAMAAYVKKLPRPSLDGGYYTKTRDNRPLACSLPIEGAYLIGAFSGFGIMAAPAMGDLLSAHITGSALPAYAPAFCLERYQDTQYQSLLETWGDAWQL